MYWGVGLACIIAMSLKNQAQQQNESPTGSPHQDESYECNQTISDISLEFNEQKRNRQCQCTCRCKLKTHQATDHLEKKERKRLKRKNNKLRLKNRQKQQQEQALLELQLIIQDIYTLEITFDDAQEELKACLSIDINRDKLYDFINSNIRNQVERIRQRIADDLSLLPKTKECYQRELIKGVFQNIQMIREASPEIEKLINLFVSTRFNPQTEHPPYQKNLDELTYSYLMKNYLQKSESFVVLCELIFRKEDYAEEKQLFQLMMNAYKRYDPQQSDSEEDEEYSDSGYDSEEWEQENAKRIINLSLQQEENQSRSRRRRERKRRIKQEHDQDYESILRRMEGMSINQFQRVNCNVEEGWVQHIVSKRQQYTTPPTPRRTFNPQ